MGNSIFVFIVWNIFYKFTGEASSFQSFKLRTVHIQCNHQTGRGLQMITANYREREREAKYLITLSNFHQICHFIANYVIINEYSILMIYSFSERWIFSGRVSKYYQLNRCCCCCYNMISVLFIFWDTNWTWKNNYLD